MLLLLAVWRTILVKQALIEQSGEKDIPHIHIHHWPENDPGRADDASRQPLCGLRQG